MFLQSYRRPLIAAVGNTLSIRVFGLISTFGFASIASFLLPANDFGQLATLLSMILFMGTIGEFGQRDLVAREISKGLALRDAGHSSEKASLAVIISLVFGLVCGLVVAGFYMANGATPTIVFCSSILTAILSINGALSGIGRAHGMFVWAMAPREVLWRLLTLAIILLILGLVGNATIETGAISLLSALLICVGLQFLRFKSIGFVPTLSIHKLKECLDMKYLKSSFDLMMVNAAGLILVSMDVVAVGILLGNEDAAQYFPANRIAVLTIYVQVTLNLAIAPRLAQEFAQDRTTQALKICRDTTKLAFLAGGIVFVIIVFSRSFLPIIFGTANDTTWLVAVILATGHLVTIATGFGGTALVAAGHERSVRDVMIWTVPFGLTAIACACLSGSIVFVAAAVALATVVRGVLIAYTCRALVGGHAAIA